MKVKFLVILMIILFPYVLIAHPNNKGFKFAYTSSGIYHDRIDNFASRRNGFNIALFYEFGNHKFLSFIAQIEYAQKGFVEKQVETNETGEIIQNVKANTRLDYLSIPLLIKFKYPRITPEPYFIFGPRFEYLINKRNGVFHFSQIDFKSQFVDHLDKFVFGGSFGAGFRLAKIYRLNTLLEFRYHFDFSDSFSKIEEATVKHNSYNIGLAISF